MDQIDWILTSEIAQTAIRIAVAVLKPLLTIVVWYIADRLMRKLVSHTGFIDRILTKRATSQAARDALAGRITTFKGLFVHLLRILNALFFIFVLLGTFGIDPAPVLAGIGVVGLGISLAAQNILRDFLSGMFILIEDQYNVGDLVKINGSWFGTVEHFSMRLTSLRHLDGTLFTIPNGAIEVVQNMTKDFSVALVLVDVPYTVDARTVLAALDRAGRTLREKMPEKTIDEPITQGIVDFKEFGSVMRMLVRTLPGYQWEVERELRILIREEFERSGIPPAMPRTRTILEDAR